MANWTDRKRHIVDQEHLIKGWGSRFGCLLCGHMFEQGDGYRWIYSNEGNGTFIYGNFFTCDACDDGDEQTKIKAKELTEKANRVLVDRLADHSKCQW